MSKLARTLGLRALIFYGIGDILGAGIYALVGRVIDTAGYGAWLSFVLAALVALLTGLSYAELTARHPSSAGAAGFVHRAFPNRLVATITGIVILGTAVVSAATVTVAFSEYLAQLLAAPSRLIQMLWLAAIAFLGFWGIRESSRVNVVLTVVEISGLLLIIALGVWLFFGDATPHFGARTSSDFEWLPILQGLSLAFYAYIGFEDLAHLADECREPRRDLPRAILVAIAVSSVIYILVALALLLNVSLAEIKKAETPLLLLFEKAGLGDVSRYFSLVALMAITNTGMLNLIMASRLSYGMAQERLLPKVFEKVHPRRKTPWVGVLFAFGLVAILVWTGGLKMLAQMTSFLVLLIFSLVHLSLIVLKRRREPHRGVRVPIFCPILGLVASLGLLAFFPWEIWLRSLVLPTLGVGVWLLQRPRKS